jgi:hypothetical protein
VDVNVATTRRGPAGPTDFRDEALPMRVRFGAGSLASLPEELDEIGLRRVLVLCSPGQEDTGELVTSALGERSVGLRADAVMHVPAQIAGAPCSRCHTGHLVDGFGVKDSLITDFAEQPAHTHPPTGGNWASRPGPRARFDIVLAPDPTD